MSLGRRLAAGLAGIALFACGMMIAVPRAANAAVAQGLGYAITPAQPYRNNPDSADWTGSYLVSGQPVWCVDFAYRAPDSNEPYKPGQTLLTKWGTPLDPTVAAEISYLLLRYGNTTSADDAAALAHLLHSWTAAPQNPGQLSPTNDFKHIAYDIDYHFHRLPPSAQRAVTALTTDASTNHGPWSATLTQPATPQIIGTSANWTFAVRNPGGHGVSDVPVTFTATDATLPGGSSTIRLSTNAHGDPLTIAVTPTGPNPTIVASLASPADAPVVRVPLTVNTQQVVGTGGERGLSVRTTTTARTAPGGVRVHKIDANSKSPIASASVEFTAADQHSPAIKQDGTPLVGAKGRPVTGPTGADGTAAVSGLRTPQQVCVVEVAAPPGYDQAFNPAKPPSACGTVRPHQTLELTLSNVANKVPVAIPAGGPPLVTVRGVVDRIPDPAALIGFGAVFLAAAGVAGSRRVRRSRNRR